MVRLSDMPAEQSEHLAALPCEGFSTQPWVLGPPLAERRIALVSTAGLHRRGDQPFTGLSGEYRVIPEDIPSAELVMSHISTNFDRTGFQQDWNLVFPLDRLRELARRGMIAGVADFHYSFMGATEPRQMESQAREVAGLLKKDGVDGVLLVPV